MLHDAHNHLHDPWLAPHRAQILADLARLPLATAVVNGTSPEDWPEVAALCSQHSTPNTQLRPAYGLHPWHVGNAPSDWQPRLVAALDSDPRASLGEVGLDRWILDRASPDDPRLAGLRRAPLAEQHDAFLWQLRLAAQRDLPVTIHCLDAWGPLADTLRHAPLPARGFLLHAYGGSAELAREFAALGAYFSFNAHFLADRHRAKRDVFAALPIDRLLVETDAPAMPLPAHLDDFPLPPTPDGQRPNHPANILAAYTALATLRGTTLEALASQVETNFHRLFSS